MGRPPRQLPSPSPSSATLPAAEDTLEAVTHIMAPMIRLLLSCGVDYVRFAAVLKQTFIEQAQSELEEAHCKDTDSALSLLSGVHRKDVRYWRENGMGDRIARKVSLSSQVFSHWIQNPLYRDRFKNPKPLLRIGDEISFETLVRQITQDVHPYTVLSELVRLGLVTIRKKQGQDWVIPSPRGFVPPAGSTELMELFSGNLGDHVSAAVSNIKGHGPRLEQSVFVSGLTPESAAKLAQLSQKLWSQVRSEMIRESSLLYEQDRNDPQASCRIRFGSYFWDAPLSESPDVQRGETPDNDPSR